MARSIAEYLLHIARDSAAHRTHHASDNHANGAMAEFGLTDAQRQIILTCDDEAIALAAQLELDEGTDWSDASPGFDVTFHVCVACPPTHGVPGGHPPPPPPPPEAPTDNPPPPPQLPEDPTP